jgi:hypothetical protein
MAYLGQLAKSGDHWAVAVIEESPCQVVVGFFRPDPRDFTHTGALYEQELESIGGELPIDGDLDESQIEAVTKATPVTHTWANKHRAK